jgi:uncharacterized protein (TIGR03083 family)
VADVSDLAADERRDLADYLDTLTAEEWERPSLCRGWSVRDVPGHVTSYDMLSWPALLALFARSGFSLSRGNQARLQESRRLPAEELTARLRAHAVPTRPWRGRTGSSPRCSSSSRSSRCPSSACC